MTMTHTHTHRRHTQIKRPWQAKDQCSAERGPTDHGTTGPNDQGTNKNKKTSLAKEKNVNGLNSQSWSRLSHDCPKLASNLLKPHTVWNPTSNLTKHMKFIAILDKWTGRWRTPKNHNTECQTSEIRDSPLSRPSSPRLGNSNSASKRRGESL